MRIAIINLTAGGMSGGYKKYLRNMIPLMARDAKVESILCASPANLKVHTWFQPYDNVKFANCLPYNLFHRGDPVLKRELEKFSPDVIFLPIERYLSFNNVPVVNMIQNMLPMVSVSNNPFHEKIRNYVQRYIAKMSVRKVQRVIAISNYVREYLIYKWGVNDELIGVVYHGVDQPAEKGHKRVAGIPSAWENMFLFTAGSIDPYRGLEDIIFAINLLNSRGIRVPLVIAGNARPSMSNYHNKLKDMITKMNLNPYIYWTGFLDEKEMSWCYTNCKAFIMTSRVESFGMIAGEAMAHGCVCVSADNPCLPEIFGSAALYYKPKDYHALANAIMEVLSWDEAKRKQMSDRARRRAAQFSWEVCAQKTVDQLQLAIEEYTQKRR